MTIYYFPIILTLSASLLCLIESDSLSWLFSLFASVMSVVLSFCILFLKKVPGGIFYIDGFSKIMLVVISMIYFTTVLFSLTYLRHVKKPLLRKNIYYLFLNLFVSSMVFSVSVGNLGLLWIGIEATTITSALLVAIDNDAISLESSWRYIIIVSTGLIISLVGIVFIYAGVGTLDISKLLTIKQHSSKLVVLGAALAITGFSTKAGIFPMHTWLPDVHGRSIAPVSALFSSVLLPTALFGAYRIIQIAPPEIRSLSLIFGFLTVIFASFFIVSQQFYKRMFAYSSMENMGIALTGLSIDNHYAFLGALMLLISHAFAKSSLFYTTGNILSVYKSREIDKIKGMATVFPTGAYSFVLSALAVTGAPPFGTFIGELFIIYAIYLKFGLILCLILILFLAISFFALNYKVSKISFSPRNMRKQSLDLMSSFVPVLNAFISFAVLFLITYVNMLINSGVIR